MLAAINHAKQPCSIWMSDAIFVWWRQPRDVWSGGRLNLDDLGTVVGKVLRGPRPKYNPGQVQDLYAF